MSDVHRTNRAHGGGNAEMKRAFATGITVDHLREVDFRCTCTWVPRGGLYALKYTNANCGVSNHFLMHKVT